ncbi:hypothetical protein AB8O53_24790, partial [Streptomyces pilosus]
ALDGYAEGLERQPGDPHLLAGWIVARAALRPGPDARRTLARPELLLRVAGPRVTASRAADVPNRG